MFNQKFMKKYSPMSKLLVLVIFGKRNKFSKQNKGLFVYTADNNVSSKPILTSCCSQTHTRTIFYFSKLRNWFISYFNSLSVQAVDKKHKTALHIGKVLKDWVATKISLLPDYFIILSTLYIFDNRILENFKKFPVGFLKNNLWV